MEFIICKEFGWTINELYAQPGIKVMRFMQIIHLRNQVERQDQGKQNV